MPHIQTIFDKFDHLYNYKSSLELNSGHINDTYFIETDGDVDYVLQKVNNYVFRDVPGMMRNKVSLSKHIESKLYKQHTTLEGLKFVKFIPLKENVSIYYYENLDKFWNLQVFIKDSKVYETVRNEKIAYESGQVLGDFLNLSADFDSRFLVESIPRFHDMSFRFHQYENALKIASPERLELAKENIEKVKSLREKMYILQRFKENGKIPMRVTHNDTKVSNILFDKNDAGICLIDTDTVMPGIVHYDFGDAIRSICNCATEDEKNINKVKFNHKYYKAFEKGFLDKMELVLSDLEIEHLPLAAKTMTFIMALRFLTDFLNNDIYYKTSYETHNLVRSNNQFRLIESMGAKLIF